MRISCLLPVLFVFTPVVLNAQGLFESSLAATGQEEKGLYQLQGGIKSAVYAGIRAEENEGRMQSIYSQFDLGIEIPAGRFGKGYAELRSRYGHEFGSSLSQFELREAYADVYLGPLTLRAGKQIINWGTSSFVNPSDRFSPTDPVFRSPDPDDLRLGTWAVNTTLAIGNSSRLELLWRPDYRPSVLLTAPFEMPTYIEILPYTRAQQRFSDGGFGFQYDLRANLLDLQLSYYNGYRNTPVLYTETLAIDTATFAPERIGLGQAPVRVQTAGLNMTLPLGSYLLRTEIGWLDAVEDSLIASPFTELGYTLEIERSGSNVSFIAGYYGKMLFDFVPTPVETSLFQGRFPSVTDLFPPGTSPGPAVMKEYIDTQVKGFNRLYEYQQEEFMHSAYAVFECALFHDMLKCKLPAMYNFTYGELTLLPSVEWMITDGLKAGLGAYYLEGKEGSLFDMAGPALNAGYLLLHYTF